MPTPFDMAPAASMLGPLSFMGTELIRDREHREQIIEDKLAKRVATTNGPDENGTYRRTHYSDLSHVRVPGGKAAGPKPIKANYDADDDRIVDLKQRGYTDVDVAKKLAEEGRVRYVARTVGSRWLRIRKALEAKEEEMLEDEMSDWHDDQDERLEQAVKEIDAKIEKEIAKLQEKKWLHVATHVADLIGKKKYTPRLCRERYDSLMDGTALTPIELDSDQEKRANMRETRITENKRLRKEAAREQELEEERKAAAAAAKKEIRDANAGNRISKAQHKRFQAEQLAQIKKDGIEQRKRQKLITRQWIAYNKAEATWLNRKQNTERILTNKLLGLALSYRRPRSRDDEDEELYDEEVAFIEEETEDDADDEIVVSPLRKHHRSPVSDSDNPTPRKKKGGYISPASTTRSSPRLANKSASPRHIAVGEVPVTIDTLANKRSILTHDELDRALRFRDLPGISKGETHEQAVARFDAEDKLLSLKALKEILQGRSIETHGTRLEMVLRLQEYEASRCRAAELGGLY